MTKRHMILLLLSLLCACGNINKDNGGDSFYTECSGWSLQRLPLIKPYEVLNAGAESKSSDMWTLKFDSDKLFSTDNIQKVSVVDSVIYVLSGMMDGKGDSSALVGSMYPTVWFVVNTKNGEKKGFSHIAKFNDFISNNDYPQPQWHNIDSLFTEFCQNEKRIPWSPAAPE